MQWPGRLARCACVRWLALVLVPVVAHAAPVAEGYELDDNHGTLVVTRGKRHAELEHRIGTFLVRELVVDKAARRVTVPVDENCHARESVTYSLDQLEARLVNTEALAVHRKRDWAAAAKGFAAAVKLDATWRLPAYNLASALAEQKDLTGAVAAVAPWLASEPIATYLQVAQDPELQPLLATPELAALRAPKPGTMKVAAGRVVGTFGFAPARGLVAAETTTGDGMSCGRYTAVTWFDAKTGAQLGSLALSHTDGCEAPGKPIAAAPHRSEVVERILDDLGFVATPFEYADAHDNDTGTRVVRLPKSALGVVVDGGGTIQILRKDRALAKGHAGEDRLGFAAYLADVKLAVVGTRRESDECPADALDALPVP